MIPIVHGLKQRYRGCLDVTEVNFHRASPLHEALRPLGSPEFALLDADEQVLYRWYGFTEAEEFDAVLQPLCGSE